MIKRHRLFSLNITGREGIRADPITITSALTSVWEVVTGCVNFITGNEVMMILLCSGLAITGFRIFKRAKKAVR